MANASVEFVVSAADGVRIAGIDHGGSGPDLLLVPGFGANLLSLTRLVRHLSAFRVVAIDLRGHGLSDESDRCTFDDFVDDLERVVAHLRLANPIVGGHSVGGNIAVGYGERHPDCPGVFNIDGGFGLNAEPSLYVDLSDAERRAWHELNERARAGAEAPVEESGDAAWVDEQVAQQMRAFGSSTSAMERFIRRNYTSDNDGTFHRRPSSSFVRRVLGHLLVDEGLAPYQRMACPSLIFTTLGRTTSGPDILNRVARLRIDGLASAAEVLRSEGRDVTVVHVPSLHSTVIVEAAEQLGTEITRFALARLR